MPQFPAVSEALWQAASAQIRNMATIGGNLLQRTRCAYFRDPASFPACNKRVPGSGCSAMEGVNRGHAVLGTSDACIATYPGDLAAALVAFDAVVHLGERKVAIDDFFLLPGTTPHKEHAMQPGEMITAITIPASAAARHSTYLKVRDRQSYEFAAASAAVGIEFEADHETIRDIRIGLGGVATKPWRARAVEDALRGKVLEPETIKSASRLAVEGAVAHGGNHYKIELAPRVIERAILKIGSFGMTIVDTKMKRGDASDGLLGGRLARIDGPAKITGAADYAMEHSPEGMVYAVIIDSTIASGRVVAIDTRAAEAYPGVLLVLTPDNALPIKTATDWTGAPPPDGSLRAARTRDHIRRPAHRRCHRRDLRAGDRCSSAHQGHLRRDRTDFEFR